MLVPVFLSSPHTFPLRLPTSLAPSAPSLLSLAAKDATHFCVLLSLSLGRSGCSLSPFGR